MRVAHVRQTSSPVARGDPLTLNQSQRRPTDSQPPAADRTGKTVPPGCGARALRSVRALAGPGVRNQGRVGLLAPARGWSQIRAAGLPGRLVRVRTRMRLRRKSESRVETRSVEKVGEERVGD
jgi:hypothetical protein